MTKVTYQFIYNQPDSQVKPLHININIAWCGLHQHNAHVMLSAPWRAPQWSLS